MKQDNIVEFLKSFSTFYEHDRPLSLRRRPVENTLLRTVYPELPVLAEELRTVERFSAVQTWMDKRCYQVS